MCYVDFMNYPDHYNDIEIEKYAYTFNTTAPIIVNGVTLKAHVYRSKIVDIEIHDADGFYLAGADFHALAPHFSK